MRVRFEQVKIKGTRRWTENGKRRQETETFMQTVNPFNKDENGKVKTREIIQYELLEERHRWLMKTPKST